MARETRAAKAEKRLQERAAMLARLAPLQHPKAKEFAAALRIVLRERFSSGTTPTHWDGMTWIREALRVKYPQAAQTEWPAFAVEFELQQLSKRVADKIHEMRASQSLSGTSQSSGLPHGIDVRFGIPRNITMSAGGLSGLDGICDGLPTEAKSICKVFGKDALILNNSELVRSTIEVHGVFFTIVFVLRPSFDENFGSRRMNIPGIAERRQETVRDKECLKKKSRRLKSAVDVISVWALEVTSDADLGYFQRGLMNSNNNPRAEKRTITKKALESGSIRGERLWEE